MKLVPKVHKIKGLPSRPIRGAEADPIRFPSKVLYNLLKNMLSDLREMYKNITIHPQSYPILQGCDDYITRISNVKLLTENHIKTVLITADFSDAYTETDIDRLRMSIRLITNWDQPTLKVSFFSSKS